MRFIFLLTILLIAGAAGAEEFKSPAKGWSVWRVAEGELQVSKSAFDDYAENQPPHRKLLLYQLEGKMAEVTNAISLRKIIKDAKANPPADRLFRRTEFFALYSKQDGGWYLLMIETGEAPHFEIGKSDMVFDRILARSEESVCSDNARFVNQLRTLTASSPESKSR